MGNGAFQNARFALQMANFKMVVTVASWQVQIDQGWCPFLQIQIKPIGNCNHRLENSRLQTGRLQTGHFEMPRFPCSELQRLDLTHL